MFSSAALSQREDTVSNELQVDAKNRNKKHLREIFFFFFWFWSASSGDALPSAAALRAGCFMRALRASEGGDENRIHRTDSFLTPLHLLFGLPIHTVREKCVHCLPQSEERFFFSFPFCFMFPSNCHLSRKTALWQTKAAPLLHELQRVEQRDEKRADILSFRQLWLSLQAHCGIYLSIYCMLLFLDCFLTRWNLTWCAKWIHWLYFTYSSGKGTVPNVSRGWVFQKKKTGRGDFYAASCFFLAVAPPLSLQRTDWKRFRLELFEMDLQGFKLGNLSNPPAFQSWKINKQRKKIQNSWKLFVGRQDIDFPFSS